ncbi:MAG: glycosyltransferase family 2 protein [Candidatus Omnitrophota bacterium]
MKISIITVVYNNAEHIGDCLKSVTSQLYNDIEYIVIDNESRDGTQDVINLYKDKITRLVSEKDKGHIYAMNKGIEMATGDVVGFLHSDDIYMNENIIGLVADTFKNSSTDSLYGDLVYVKKDNIDKTVRFWRAGSYSPDSIKQGWMPPHPTFFVKREVYKKYGLLDTGFKISMDYEIILRFLYKQKISVLYLPSVLVKMRSGGVSNRSIKNILVKTMEDYRAAKSYGLGVSAVIMKNIGKIPQCFCRTIYI